jgi:prepilin-type N-terminal cleavage/methylation domain-containing protein
MKLQTIQGHNRPDISKSRNGVTLTEVLMSLMIMSIGLTSVAVLFPIAALRTAQATQLTNAAILKQNVAAFVKMNPRLVFDPDNDFRFALPQDPKRLDIHFQSNNRLYMVDPFGFYSFYGADNNSSGTIDGNDDEFCSWFGNDGTAPVQVVRRYDGGLFSDLGYQTYPLLPAFPLPPISTSLTTEQRRAFTVTSHAISRLGGSWSDQVDTVVENAAILTANIGARVINVGVTLGTDADLAAVPTVQGTLVTNQLNNPITPPLLAQVVVFSIDGQTSQALPLTAIVGQNVYWSEYDQTGTWTDKNNNNRVDENQLNLHGASIGRVVLQSLRPNDFNWMLSVRRSGDGRAVVDVVIRYGASMQVSDERIYPIQLTASGFVAGLRKAPDGTEPSIRRGGYLFEPVRGRWYRISSYEEKPAVTSESFWSAYDYKLFLQTEAKETRGPDLDLDGLGDVSGTIPTNSVLGGAMFIPGIVDVYPLGTLSVPDLAEMQ